MFFSFVVILVFRQVEVSATSRSLFQRVPVERGMSESDREASAVRRTRRTRGCRAMTRNADMIQRIQKSVACNHTLILRFRYRYLGHLCSGQDAAQWQHSDSTVTAQWLHSDSTVTAQWQHSDSRVKSCLAVCTGFLKVNKIRDLKKKLL
jgi:hypothetical protein